MGKMFLLDILDFCFNPYGLGLTSFRMEVLPTRKEVTGKVLSEEEWWLFHTKKSLCFLKASKLPAQQAYNPEALGFLQRSDLGALF